MTDCSSIDVPGEFNRIATTLKLDERPAGEDVCVNLGGIKVVYYEDTKRTYRSLGVSSPDTEDQFIAVQHGPWDSANIAFSFGSRRELKSLADRICSAPATP